MSETILRSRIVGRLVTSTPLHMGSGVDVKRPNPTGNDRAPDEIQAAAVACAQGRPLLPGSGLRGPIRAWLERHLAAHDADLQDLFGWRGFDEVESAGGKVAFLDGRFLNGPGTGTFIGGWDAERCTGVSAHVAIDRRTRTAEDKKLYYREFVPKGTEFEVQIVASGIASGQLDLLLAAMRGFGHERDPVCLGAETGNGWGRCDWHLERVEVVQADQLRAWLQDRNPDKTLPYQIVDDKASDTRVKALIAATTSRRLQLGLTLAFEGPFLVNDAWEIERLDREARAENPNATGPDFAPRREPDGRVVLPGESFRGAFRSQAERIVRTLGGDACDPTDKQSCCPRPSRKLCLTCQAFGAPSWRSPVSFSRFVTPKGVAEAPFAQEFVAIDRFTGGVAGSAKFNSLAVWAPRLEGHIEIELDRIEPWMLGLIILTTRDLMQGDVPFGFGASKGYGACTASLRRVSTDEASEQERLSTQLSAMLANERVAAEVAGLASADELCFALTNRIATEPARFMLNGLVEAFQNFTRASHDEVS